MKILLTILLFPLLALGQTTAPKDSTVPLGTVIGNQTVIPVPVYPPGYSMAQALIYYPDDYFQAKNANKKYRLFVFLHGAGEGRYLNISEVTNTSLPYLIKNGLKPYGIDPETGDTIKFIVVSPHCATCGGSYSFPQLKFTIPYLVANYRVDTTCIWPGGLSSGGRGAWSMAMGDGGNPSAKDTTSIFQITGIMPMANGGYDNNLAALRMNLDTADRRGLACLYVIGDQDPGYNQIGFFAYQAEMKKYCQPGRYFDSVIIGGTHSANVWNTPFPLSARLWSKTMNSWTQMWVMRKRPAVIVPPPGPAVKAKILQDSLVINYPNTAAYLFDSSYSLSGKLLNSYFRVGAYSGSISPLLTQTGTGGAWLSRLVPGVYQIKLYAFDSATNYVDTAYAYVRVNGPAPCPVCPVCPLQRKAIGFTLDAITGKFLFTYDDGSSQ